MSGFNGRHDPYRVFIVDDHPIVRHGLTELLTQEEGLAVCGQASSLPEALQGVERAHPDVAIIDISLGGDSGIELISQIKQRHPRIKMIVSSIHDEKLFAERALRAGAMGYVSKREAIRKIIDAVHQVMQGDVYLSAAMASRLLHQAVSGGKIERDPVEMLSNRELEVFEMIGNGLTTQQIAGKLCLSPKTVETHRKNIKTKLNLPNSAQLSRYAFQWVQESH